MVNPRFNRIGRIGIVIAQVLVALVAYGVLSAAAQELGQPQVGEPSVEALRSTAIRQPDAASPGVLRDDTPHPRGWRGPSGRVMQAPMTLTLSIVSPPWAVLDHNDPSGSSGPVPSVLVVEAVITNTGTTTATDLIVSLDYDEDPPTGWELLGAEYPTRTIPSLAAGAAYHAYWFAEYPAVIGTSHRYTVTARAYNASPVATGDNSYGNPELGQTVKTLGFLSTGNTGVARASARATVGGVYTVAVVYDLGTNPEEIILSPVGNPDFEPGSSRLLASEVRFLDDEETQQTVVYDRLYHPAVPRLPDNSLPDKAEVIYQLIVLTPSHVRFCAYAAVGYESTDKYDQFYCQPDKGTVVPITGTLTFSLTKQVSSLTVQQDELLTYTLNYTNAGKTPIKYAWVWDDVDTAIGSIVTTTIAPPSHPVETTDSRVAWYLGDVPQWGKPGSTGTLTFTVLIDGDGQDLADNTTLINSAFFGINQGVLPTNRALTNTVSAIVKAPTITVGKTDGLVTTGPDEALTYTLRITNSGSITATALAITDVLPVDVNYVSGTAGETSRAGQTLVWDNQGPIPPNGGTVVVTIPVTTGLKVADGTVLFNLATVGYENMAGHVFAIRTATDSTVVNAPVLSLSKSDYPDPVLTGRLLTYTLSYSNTGPADAAAVVITDVVPLSTTYQSCSGGSGCGMSSGVVSWTVGSLASGAGASVGFAVTVSETLETGTVIRNEDYGIVAEQTELITGTLETTLVNREAAYVEGNAFIDADADGVLDGGESGLAGITVTLASATVPVTTTDSAGYYRFRVEIAGPISVTAGLPSGYFRTTPGTVFTDSVLEITQTIDFGYAPVTSTFGVIYGTVFEDADHDGAQGPGEKGLSGVSITSSEAVTSPVTTEQFGHYTLRYAISGTVTISETNPPFYVSTTPDVVHTYAITGSGGPSPVDFGDFAGIRITGQVFSDTNVDGVKGAAESGVSGATIAADGDSFTTVSTGVYTVYAGVDNSNPITVTETDPAGYRSTNAVPGADMSRVDANTLRIDRPISGTVYSGGDFGDVMTTDVITISGRVWNDDGAGVCRANGWLDCDEEGLAGAVVSLSSGLTQTTAWDGLFLLYAPAGQVITVTEANPAGYVSTNAIPGDGGVSKLDNDTLIVSALAAGSTSAGNLFGDVLATGTAVITGTVFYDLNQNGLLDDGESGLPAVTVTLQISGANIIAVPTDSAGRYQFAVAPGSDARITSAGPGGSYYPTTPESVTIRPPTAGVFPDNNFGYSYDTDVALIFGVVFDDADSNGERALGELGLAGAVITLTLDGSDVATTTTSGNGLISGTFTFSVTEPGVYGLHEENPPGYRSTTPDHVNVAVVLGNSYFVEFGDAVTTTSLATIYGTVFEDVDSDGEWDAVELGIAGVEVTLDGAITTTTDLYGSYTFSVTVPGVHSVVETDLPGYLSTTPNERHVGVVLGNGYQVDFGDAVMTTSFATIYGTVFEDVDSDGEWDAVELGIAGVEVTLDGAITTTTDLYGSYTFSVTVPGDHTVVETDLPGYLSTTSNERHVEVVLGNGYQVDFGDVPAGMCTCPPDDYEDDDTTTQAVELGAGVSQAHDFCDDATDWYTFTAEAGRVYTVTTSSWGQRADTLLALYDTDAQTLLAANDDYEGTTDYSSRIVWQAPADGVYYLHTINRAELTGCHTDYDLWLEASQVAEGADVYLPIVMRNEGASALSRAQEVVEDTPTVELSPAGIISHMCPDDYELDDTWQQAELAGPIEGDVVQVHSFDSDPDLFAADKDFVGFDVPLGGAITFTISTYTNTSTLMELYDGLGAALGVTDTLGPLVWSGVPAGRYYLSVSPLSTNFGCANQVGYALHVAVADAPPPWTVFMPIVLRP